MISSQDTIWVLVSAALAFFIQAGFAMMETGFTRAKNSGNVIMKKIMSFAFSTLAFWALGFGIMHGASVLGIFGIQAPFTAGSSAGNIAPSVFFIYQAMLCAAAASIVTGAMAERAKFGACCLYGVVISAVIYPIAGHWISGGGWLSQLGFHDFAGSASIQLVGGTAAFVGALVLGPRIGKYDETGKSKAIPGHNLALAALGVFIMWFGWFGLSAGQTIVCSGSRVDIAGTVFVNIILSAAAGAVAAMCITWVRFKKPDVALSLSGIVAALAAISAGCDTVSPAGAVIIGALAGAVTVFGTEFVDKVMHIDDPVGVIGMNGISGALGVILAGLFSTKDGTFYGGGLHLLGIQLLGVIVVAAFVGVSCLAVLAILNSNDALRVSSDEELAGLDRVEHGIENSYADFMPSIEALKYVKGKKKIVNEPDKTPVSMEEAVPVEFRPRESVKADGPQITRVDILLNENKFEMLKRELNSIGITGMTVFNVFGCGMQKGGTEFYRGVEVDMTLLPKIKVEVIICKVPVRLVINAAKKALYTGRIGDGKIFVYDVENVIKVRTDEEGYEALQDEF